FKEPNYPRFFLWRYKWHKFLRPVAYFKKEFLQKKQTFIKSLQLKYLQRVSFKRASVKRLMVANPWRHFFHRLWLQRAQQRPLYFTYGVVHHYLRGVYNTKYRTLQKNLHRQHGLLRPTAKGLYS